MTDIKSIFHSCFVGLFFVCLLIGNNLISIKTCMSWKGKLHSSDYKLLKVIIFQSVKQKDSIVYPYLEIDLNYIKCEEGWERNMLGRLVLEHTFF